MPHNTPIARPLSSRVALAMDLLLVGLNAAIRRSGYDLDAQLRSAEKRYDALLCIVLRLVFMAHAERGGFLPVRKHRYLADLSLLRTRSMLRARADRDRQTPVRQYRGWPRAQRLFAAIHGGVALPDLQLPARGGVLFAPYTCAPVDGSLANSPHDEAWFDDHCLLQVLDTLLPPAADGDPTPDVRDIGGLYENAMGGRLLPNPAGDGWMIQRSHARRSTGSHYTPTSLTQPIVAQALEPLLRHMPERTPQQLLALKICDPAMGCGAFLVEACMQLGTLLTTAWRQQHDASTATLSEDDKLHYARRLVATQCLYGVDKNALAVELSKLSLWLVTAAVDQPFTFLDHAFVQGNSLIGLTRTQLDHVHWRQPALQAATTRTSDSSEEGAAHPDEATHATRQLDRVMVLAAHKRRKVQALAAGTETLPPFARQRLLDEATALLRDVHRRADAVVQIFFANPTLRTRNAALKAARLAMRRGQPPPAPADSEDDTRQRASVPDALHWPLAFPEAFIDVSQQPPRRSGMDIVIGNPPFLGGKRISTEHGVTFAAWLRAMHRSSKNVDLSAHFLRRGAALLAADASLAMITTNTLPQGATRRDGLQALMAEGMQVYHAVRTQPWPGNAAVLISICCLAQGNAARVMADHAVLDGERVNHVNSLLRAGAELSDPQRLAANRGRCFIGCFLRGKGFVLTAAEGERLRQDPRLRKVVRPFLGGEEVNNSPTHQPQRFVIDFNARPLNEAGTYAAAFDIVTSLVRPVRAKLGNSAVDSSHKSRWWQFANPRPAMRAAIAPLSRCLVAPRVSKHLSFVFQPTGRVFSDQLCIFAADDYGTFALLQSRIHDAWVRRYASTFGQGLRYTPSDCVETFPYPDAPVYHNKLLIAAGKQLYRARASRLQQRQLGLTKLYNSLHDPARRDEDLLQLRALHLQLDEVVLEAYGWEHIPVPGYGLAGHRDARELRDYYQMLVEHLHQRNSEQAAAETVDM